VRGSGYALAVRLKDQDSINSSYALDVPVPKKKKISLYEKMRQQSAPQTMTAHSSSTFKSLNREEEQWPWKSKEQRLHEKTMKKYE
jgi:hypothetical protein